MSEIKSPLDRYQRLETNYLHQSRLVILTAGIFIIAHTILLAAFTLTHSGWFKIFLGLFGLILAIAWFVAGSNVNINYGFAYRSLIEWENNLPSGERIFLVMSRQRETLKPYERIFTPGELLLRILPLAAGIFWIILIILRPT